MTTGARRRRRAARRAQANLPGIDRPFDSEYDFQREVKRLAKANGWEIVTVPRTRGQRGDWLTYALPGWPDLLLIRPPQIVALELKMPGNKPTDAQLRMIGKLQRCALPAEAWIVYPQDLATVRDILEERPDGRVAEAHRRLAGFTLDEVDRFLEWAPPADR